MKLKEYLLSWDIGISGVICLITYYILPMHIKNEYCASFFNVGITVLAIVFSIFFASLTVIMASSDNDFIRFLEIENDYTALLDSFKITLIMLFSGLLYSIVAFLITDFFIKHTDFHMQYQHKVWLCIFVFLFLYGMIATALSVKDTIYYSMFRIKYLLAQKKIEKDGTNGKK